MKASGNFFEVRAAFWRSRDFSMSLISFLQRFSSWREAAVYTQKPSMAQRTWMDSRMVSWFRQRILNPLLGMMVM